MAFVATFVLLFLLVGIGGSKLYLEETAELQRPLTIVSQSAHVEQLLGRLSEAITADDLPGYRNHIYRVLTYALHFLGGAQAVSADSQRLVEIALVYHDVGLWTDGDLAYLEPSSALVRQHFADALSPAQLRAVEDMIDNHHKITPFVGPSADLVNAVRLADWIDASQGLISKGMPRQHIRAVTDAIPNEGFHNTLLAFPSRLYGWNVAKFFRILSIFHW